MKTLQAIAIAVLAMTLAACSLDSADRSGKLTIRLSPTGSKTAGLKRPSGMSFLVPPSSISAFSCIGINVMGPGIPDSSGNPEPDLPLLFDRLLRKESYCSYRGIFRGPLLTTATTDQEISLLVPPGAPRLIQVLGIIEQGGSNDCDREFNPGVPPVLDGSGMPIEGDAYELGRAVVDLFQDQTVSIAMDYNTFSTDAERSARLVQCGGGGGGAAKLVFATQPSSTAQPTASLAAQPAIAVLDALNNPVGSATNSITLAPYSDASCTTPAGGSISAATNPLSATAGTATFAGVTYSTTGTIYIGASSAGLAPACSSAILVSWPAPVLDQASVGDNGTGAASYTVLAATAGTNRLLLLAVTWRNTTAMTTVPTGGPGGWTSVGAISQGTMRTEVFRAFASGQLTSSPLTITVPGSAKSTAVLVSFSGVDLSGSNGSGAVDNSLTASGTGANPSLSITPVYMGNTLVVGFLGSGDATAPTAGSGFTLASTVSSSGAGAPTSMATTSCEISNTASSGGSAMTVPFTRTAIDWAQLNVVLRGP